MRIRLSGHCEPDPPKPLAAQWPAVFLHVQHLFSLFSVRSYLCTNLNKDGGDKKEKEAGVKMKGGGTSLIYIVQARGSQSLGIRQIVIFTCIRHRVDKIAQNSFFFFLVYNM